MSAAEPAASPASPDFVEHRVEVPGGTVWAGIAGGGGGLPLVTLHGGPGSPHEYLLPLAALGDERPVVFYDQLGCGRSDHPDDPKLWRLDRFLAELEALRRHLALDRFHLLGHSWGAMLAVDYALAHPDRVASLVLVSPCLSMNRVRADMERLRAGLPQSLRDVLAAHEAAGTTDSPMYGVAAMAFYQLHICRRSPWPELLERSQAGWSMDVYRTMWGPAEFLPVGNLGGYEREDRLGELRAPVLYACGRHDEMTPESTAAYRDRTPGAELVIFEESAHVSHLEETEAFLAAVRPFLAAAEGGG